MNQIAICNLQWAQALCEGLWSGGVRKLVISPGSRSTPLILAAQSLLGLEIIPILDERSAAFFALGVAQASRRSVGLIGTSGSAPAHWFPAVIEASTAGIPLVLLSADRPPELRGWGANQTIDQTRLFGTFVREFHDPGAPVEGTAAKKAIRALGTRAAAVSQGSWPGPVHLNLSFREPLVPTSFDAEIFVQSEDTSQDYLNSQHTFSCCNLDYLLNKLSSIMKGRGLICCGPGALPVEQAITLWNCAEKLHLPVLCDPLSNLRCGSQVKSRITRYDSFLRNAEIASNLRPDWVLRFGRTPVSKILLSWLENVPSILVDSGRDWHDPTHDVCLRISAAPTFFCTWLTKINHLAIQDLAWLNYWAQLEQKFDDLIKDFLAQAPWCEGQLFIDLLDLIPSGEGLLCANSLPIRQLDTWSGKRHDPLLIFGNRGVSGIDGHTSTYAGLNAGGVPTTAVLGDLTFLHDLSGLWQLAKNLRPCIVLNNGGGRIFDELPQRGLPDFERLWRLAPAIKLSELAQPFRFVHQIVNNKNEFKAAFIKTLKSNLGPHLIEVTIDAERSSLVQREFWQIIQSIK